MTNFFYFITLLLFISCSSLPEKTYSKNTVKTVYSNYLTVADNARQQKNFKLALNYYDKAIQYASARNERMDVGIIRLKKAQIYLATKNTSAFTTEINHVSQMIKIEQINLADQLNFIRAKSYYMDNKIEEANAIVRNLINKHSGSFEKETYYKFQFQKYNLGYMRISEQKEKVGELFELFEDGEIENIEILSFSLYQFCTTLKIEKNKRFEKEIQNALTFYQTIENQKRIKNCYSLLSEYYSNDIEKSNYYIKLAY